MKITWMEGFNSVSFLHIQIEGQAILNLGVAGIYPLTVPQSFAPKHLVLPGAQRMLPHLGEREGRQCGIVCQQV